MNDLQYNKQWKTETKMKMLEIIQQFYRETINFDNQGIKFDEMKNALSNNLFARKKKPGYGQPNIYAEKKTCFFIVILTMKICQT